MANYEEYRNRLDLLVETGGLIFKENEPLSNHTSFKIGGKALFFVTPLNEDCFSEAVLAAVSCNIDIYFLGRGTNVLFDDKGFDGAVISTLGLDFIKINDDTVSCGAGASLTALSRVALEASLEGMSFAYGIPGSVGGAVYMNAGAYTGEIKDILISSRYLDLNDMKVYVLDKEKHKFEYRSSSYKFHPERVILSAEFKLKNGCVEVIKNEMNDFMSRRKEKQPLDYPSAGSTFKRYPGRYTAQMIDELGLKGFKVGNAQVSTKHAGFVVNIGNATSDDVKKLINTIQSRIKEAYNIDIEREVIYVPCRLVEKEDEL